MKKVSVTEYAALRGITRQAVLRALKNDWKLSGVKKSEKVGATWILYLSVIPAKGA